MDNFVLSLDELLWLAISTGVASILFFFAIYWLLPNRRVPWRHVLRTSIVTGIVWLLSKMIFVTVLPHLNLDDLYGPFLYLGRLALVGLYFGADPVRRRAVQRLALGRRQKIANEIVAVTQNFQENVQARMRNDKKFRRGLLRDAIEALLAG